MIDRILNHAIVRIIGPIFEKTFIFDSYSSRLGKGTHAAISRFRKFAWQLSQNNTKTVWILKCDIRKFFDSIDHEVLFYLIKRKIKDEKVRDLLWVIITSLKSDVGIPLGNLSSQLFSNVYMNPFDNFVKRELKVKYYIRYADDFLVLSNDRDYLVNLVPIIVQFLDRKLRLKIHPKKIFIKKWHEGVDVLGAVTFPHHSVVRTKAKKRMFRKLKKAKKNLIAGSITEIEYNQIKQSYLGKLKHTRSKGLVRQINNI